MAGVNFGPKLRGYRNSADLNQTELGEKIGYHRNAISSWENGSVVPTRETIVQMKEALGLNTSQLNDLLHSAEYAPTGDPGTYAPDLTARGFSTKNQPFLLDSPYPGLKPFDETFADYFYGRERETRELFDDYLKSKNLLAIVGPSGSGKSSLVFAGLIPLLRRETDWMLLHFQPGNNPFFTLASAYVPVLEPEMSQGDLQAEINRHAKKLAVKEFTLAQILARTLKKNNSGTMLLIIDQFEGLLTTSNQDEQKLFIDQLLSILKNDSCLQIKVLITLLSDFQTAAINQGLANTLNAHQVNLGEMDRKDLSRVIEKPASKVGVKFEDRLVSRILDDIGNEPGKLPLLQFALSKLYEKQNNKTITFSAYEEIGKVEGALSEHAQNIYKNLTNDEQVQAPKLFMRLVKLGLNNKPIRRPANQSELLDIGIDAELIQKIAATRLIVKRQLKGSEETIVELAHEALIDNWKQYRNWVDEHKDYYSWRSKLRENIIQWKEFDQDESALLRGAVLKIAEEMWRNYPNEDLTKEEQDYIIKSQELAKSEDTASRQRAAYLHIFGSLIGGFGFLVAFLILFVGGEREVTTVGTILRFLVGSVAGSYFVIFYNILSVTSNGKKGWILAGLAGVMPLIFLFLFHVLLIRGNFGPELAWPIAAYGAIGGIFLGLSTKILSETLQPILLMLLVLSILNAIVFVVFEKLLNFPISATSKPQYENIFLAGIVLSGGFLLSSLGQRFKLKG